MTKFVLGNFYEFMLTVHSVFSIHGMLFIIQQIVQNLKLVRGACAMIYAPCCRGRHFTNRPRHGSSFLTIEHIRKKKNVLNGSRSIFWKSIFLSVVFRFYYCKKTS